MCVCVYTDQASLHDLWQVKWITLIVSSSPVSRIYQAASEHVVLKVDVLAAVKMCEREGLSFDKLR